MILIQVASGIPPQQVDDFGEGVERSVKGALYFRPNTLRTVTRGEYDHICTAHPHLASKLHVIKDTGKTLPPDIPREPVVSWDSDVPPGSEP